MQNGISKPTTNEGWYGFHNSERKTRYFEHLSTKYYKRYNIWTLLMTTCGGIIAVIGALFDGAIPYIGITVSQAIIILGTVVLTLGGFAIDSSRKAVMLHAVYAKCSLIRYKYKMLWLEIKNRRIDDDEVIQRLQELDNQQDDATSIAGFFGIMKDEKLNNKASTETANMMKIQYEG